MTAPQLPLALRYPPDQRLDRFVGAPDGLVEALRSLAEGMDRDWVYLGGPTGSGKTHLCLATCAHASGRGLPVAYLPLGTLAGCLEGALSGQDEPWLYVLDGLDSVAGHRGDEVALFDFHNRTRAGGGRVLYAGSVDPMHLPIELPDLRSRLAQCVRFNLAPLDEAGRREVLRQRAHARGLGLDEAVLDWLLVRVGRDLGTLGALFDRIDRESLAAKRRVTIPFLRGLLGSGTG